MRSTLSNLLMFAAGAALGVSATWKYFKEKYKRIADEEIDSVREYYLNKKPKYEGPYDSDEETRMKARESHEKPDIREYAEKLKDLEYRNYSSSDRTVEREEKDVDGPYVIAPEEYGELHDYQTIELTHYGDGILAENTGEIVDDADDIVGPDYADHFGEYEDDSVYIRNDKRKCDYLILLEERPYDDAVCRSYPSEDE